MHTFIGERGHSLVFREAGREIAHSPDRALFPGGVTGITIGGPMTFPYEGALAFPLSIGQKWRFSRVLESRDQKLTTRADARVEAWESVKAAGAAAAVGAFRIEIEETEAPPIRYYGVAYWTVWFAPEARCVVKWSLDLMPNFRTRGAELVEFQPAR